MQRKDRNFNKPEDFADEIRETMSTFESFAEYLRGTEGGDLIITEYDAKMEKHLQCLQQLFDEFRCSKGDPC